jgi:hypothetical protein
MDLSSQLFFEVSRCYVLALIKVKVNSMANPERWRQRTPGRWREQAGAWQIPEDEPFQTLGQRGTWVGQRRLRRARQALAFWGRRLDAVRDIIDALDQRLAAALDDEESSEATAEEQQETKRPRRTS